MGWQPTAFSEIEPFPCAVLAHHYPTTPNWGDMTRFKEWPDANINVLVGGTPCQSFSVAGLRKGLDDPRGNLMLTYLAIADRYRPKWVVWENVPGVLSSNSGRDFGSFLGGLGQLGYGFAYRVLDAQYFGVAQRRRRVFVVGCLGGWQRAAAVLFERHSLQGHTAPRREKREEVAGTIEASLGRSRGAGTPPGAITARMVAFGEYSEDDTASAMKARDYKDATDLVVQPIAYTLSGGSDRGLHVNKVQVATCLDTHNASGEFREQSQNAQTLVTQPIAFSGQMSNPQTDMDITQTLGAKNPMAVAYVGGVDYENNGHTMDEPTGPLMKGSPTGGGRPLPAIATSMQVRRLTPVECERLQGFPDGYTDIKLKGKPTPDGPRYKALGNSMNTAVMRWIGERIQAVEEIIKRTK